MNDYEFSNLLFKLRTKAKLTQKDLKDKLSISNKTIPKCENGKAKPPTNTLKK